MKSWWNGVCIWIFSCGLESPYRRRLMIPSNDLDDFQLDAGWKPKLRFTNVFDLNSLIGTGDVNAATIQDGFPSSRSGLTYKCYFSFQATTTRSRT